MAKRRVEFGGEEGEEEVKEVNAEGVCDCFFKSNLLVIAFSADEQSKRDIPIYHPCARTIRRKKNRRRTTLPIHRYVVYGVNWSKYAWYC